MNEDERQIDLNKLLEQLGLKQVKPTYTVKFESNSFKKGGRKSLRRKNIKTDHWVELDLIDHTKFDFSWHPDSLDSPYIYK
jgi:hypothetical protein